MLRSFLQKAAYAAKQPLAAKISDPAKKITICIGNEASDADSIVSSLCLAYLKQQQHAAAHSAAGEEEEDKAFVPVVSVPRSILKLRRETQLLLRSVGLELEDLICLDELDLQALADSCALQALVLTDHNLLGACVTSKLRGGAAAAEGLVQGIVDHHQDQGAYLGSCPAGASSRVIAFDSGTNMATAGSACTLVAELMLQAAAAAAAPPAASAALQDVAILLQGVICIDTQNMDACGVGTARDASALNALEEKVAGKVERNATFTLLRDAKSDPVFWDGLNALECMCIDYKQFTQVSGAEVGIASTLLPIMQFLEKEDSCAQMAQYMSCPTLEGSSSEAGAEAAATTIEPLEMLLVMSTVYTPEFRRELLLASFDEERVDALATFLQAQGNSIRLQPQPLPIQVSDAAAKAVHGLHLRVFHQGNAKASRKQIAPLLQKFYGSA